MHVIDRFMVMTFEKRARLQDALHMLDQIQGGENRFKELGELLLNEMNAELTGATMTLYYTDLADIGELCRSYKKKKVRFSKVVEEFKECVVRELGGDKCK